MHIQLYIILNIMWGRLMNWMMMSVCCDNSGALHTLTVVIFLDIINKTLFSFFQTKIVY